MKSEFVTNIHFYISWLKSTLFILAFLLFGIFFNEDGPNTVNAIISFVHNWPIIFIIIGVILGALLSYPISNLSSSYYWVERELIEPKNKLYQRKFEMMDLEISSLILALQPDKGPSAPLRLL